MKETVDNREEIMKIETFHYRGQKGWTTRNFSKMDSEEILILTFSTHEIISNSISLKEVAPHYSI